MKNSLARYRLYKSIGYSDREIDLMQIDADLLRDARDYLAIQERLMELTKYNCYSSDGRWLPDSAQFWEKQFDEEWRRKLDSDKFMLPSKKLQYKAVLAYEICELAEDYIKQYGISGNELLKLAVDAYLDYLRLPQLSAPSVAPELPQSGSRELWEKIYERFLNECKDHKHRLAYFSYLYWRLQDDKLISGVDWSHARFKRKLASDGVLNNESVEFDKLKERNAVKRSPAQNIYNAILQNVK